MDIFSASLRLRDVESARSSHQQKLQSTLLRRNLSAKRLQRAFRQLLRRRAVRQAQQLLLPRGVRERLLAVLARSEARAAARVQAQWRKLR